MIHKRISPEEGYAKLKKEGKQWLLRESREDGMLTIDFKSSLSAEQKAEIQNLKKAAQEKKQKLESIHNITPELQAKIEKYDNSIKKYDSVLVREFDSRRYAVIDNQWYIVEGKGIDVAKAKMTPYDSLSSAQQKQYVESLFDLLLKEKFTPDNMRQPPPAEASQKSSYRALALDNYTSFSAQKVSGFDHSIAKSSHSVFASASKWDAPPPNEPPPSQNQHNNDEPPPSFQPPSPKGKS